MVRHHNYYFYIMTNRNNSVLYAGVTNNLIRRVQEHRCGEGSHFTKRYNINKLVHYEHFSDIRYAIKREKQIKAGSRKRKIELISANNPEWGDLYETFNF